MPCEFLACVQDGEGKSWLWCRLDDKRCCGCKRRSGIWAKEKEELDNALLRIRTTSSAA